MFLKEFFSVCLSTVIGCVFFNCLYTKSIYTKHYKQFIFTKKLNFFIKTAHYIFGDTVHSENSIFNIIEKETFLRFACSYSHYILPFIYLVLKHYG